jgi:hypothetical protein
MLPSNEAGLRKLIIHESGLHWITFSDMTRILNPSSTLSSFCRKSLLCHVVVRFAYLADVTERPWHWIGWHDAFQAHIQCRSTMQLSKDLLRRRRYIGQSLSRISASELSFPSNLRFTLTESMGITRKLLEEHHGSYGTADLEQVAADAKALFDEGI